MAKTNYFNLTVASVISVAIFSEHVFAQDAVAPAAPAPAAVAAAPAPASADQWQQEFAVWQAAAQGNTIDEYQGYLSAYPNGKFATIAQARIVKLTAAKDEATTASVAPETAAPPAQDMPSFTMGTPGEEAVILADRATRREVQGRLTSLGFSTGGVDGALGARSRSAISEWQGVVSAPITGYLSFDQLTKLRVDSESVYRNWLAMQPAPRPVRRGPGSGDVLVGRVEDRSAADAAIALGIIGLTAGVIGGVAAGRGRHWHGGRRYYRGRRW